MPTTWFRFLCMFVCLSIFGQGWAQSQPIRLARTKVYQGYKLNQPYQWREGINLLRKAVATQPDNKLKMELAMAEYGYIGYCVASKTCSDLDQRIERTQDLLEDLVEQPSYQAPAYAILGGVLAMRIGLSPAKALYLGPRSSNYLDKAMSLAPNSPYTWVEHGNMRFHAPSVFGGDKEGAIEAFKKAIDLFDQQPTEKFNNWLYLHALAWLGQAYEATGQDAKAKQTYQRALAVAPDFSWIKIELLPSVNGKAAGKR